MAAGPYCSLCGGCLQDAASPGVQSSRWTTFVRSVRGLNGVGGGGRSSITGVGRIMGMMVVAPEGDQADLADEGSRNIGASVPIFNALNGRLGIFHCHETCWQLLLLQIAGISQHPPDPVRTGALLFDIFDSTPWGRDGDLIPESNYRGAISMRRSEEGCRLLNADPGKPFLPRNNSIISLEKYGLAVASNSRVRPSGRLSHTDPFFKLPGEIIHHITLHLPSEDLPSARLASRRLGILCATGSLPQSFWASRFAHNREMGCLYGAKIPPWVTQDWFQAYFCCNWSVAGADALGNRRRIWRCLSDLSDILGLLLNSGGDKQLDMRTLSQNQSFTHRVSSPELPRRSMRDNLEKTIHLGVRLQNEHNVFLHEKGDDSRVQIEFSSIVLSSAEYISGYRVSVQHPDGRPRDVQTAGVIIASTMPSFVLDPGDKISYVDVYISTSGIHCLKFFIAKPDGETCIHSVGKPRCRHDIIAVKRLTPESTVVGFKFGFAMYKAVAIQLIEDTKQNLELSPVALWNATLPPAGNEDLTALPIPTPHERAMFPVNLYMPFGGADGSRLSSLRSITAFVHGTAGIYGLRFTYSKGEPVMYGNQEFMEPEGGLISCVEQTLLVDGENGERVVQFAPGGKLGRQNLVENIVAHTNFKHHYVFGPFDGSELKCDEVLPSEQSAIFAVVASVSAPDWKFQSLQSQKFRAPCSPLPYRSAAHLSSLQHAGPAPALAPWMNQGEGSCLTTASLEWARRIRISGGTDGSCRSRNHISGLWIEYYKDRRDVVIGQWIKETACVSLQPNERIVDVTIWSTMDVKLPFPMLELGKISGIEFGFATRRNRFKLRQMSPELGDQTCVRYVATPFEDITSITWAFNSRMDDVQVRLKPNRLLAQKTLAFGHAEKKPRPVDLSDGQSRSFFEYGGSHFILDFMRPRELSMRYHFPRNTYFFESMYGRRLTRIEISPDADDNIAGLAFHYNDHRVVEQGTCNDRSVSLHLDHEKNEKISLLMVYEEAERKKGLEFRSNLGQAIRIVPENKHFHSLTVFSLDPAAQAPNIHSFPSFKPSVDKVTIHEFPAVGGNQEPIESCVGIWTVSEHTRDDLGLEFDDIGPIFISRSNGGTRLFP
ncbi:unnamed protein product [Clonostachys rhizophaga]|uniref:F-box domain-containing protein n=1 Tax=Clonostachys rhizophaga TaxID=160324 RepID=A0A9N9YW40_9HYPO|nr:unnamed protein product [Clonostachys rhizophaga]